MIPVPYTDGGGSTYARVYRVRCVCMCVSCTVVCSNDPTPSLFVVSLFFFFPQPSKEGANGNAATIIMFKMFKGLWTFPRARRCFKKFMQVSFSPPPHRVGFPPPISVLCANGIRGEGGLLFVVVGSFLGYVLQRFNSGKAGIAAASNDHCIMSLSEITSLTLRSFRRRLFIFLGRRDGEPGSGLPVAASSLNSWC
jgi:hypothetical protein